MVSATDIRIIVTTAATRDEAQRIAQSLVEGRLAACVNLLPGLTSTYRWHGEIENTDEILLIVKTTVTHVEEIEAALQTLHSYEIPEFLVFHPESVSEPYLHWLVNSVR